MPINGVHQKQPCCRPLPERTTTPIEDQISRICHLEAEEVVAKVELVPGHLQKVFHVSLSSGRHLLLKVSPPPSTKLLRRESRALSRELTILEKMASAGFTTPRIVSQESTVQVAGRPHLLLDHRISVPLSTLSPVSEKQKAAIGMSLANWLESVSRIRSSVFGTTHHHAASWRTYFQATLDAMLSEAEDMMISLPYDQIRLCLRGYGHVLEEVTTPSLVFWAAARQDNLMVDPSDFTVTGLVDYSSGLWGDSDILLACNRTNDTRVGSAGADCAAKGSARVRLLL